MILESKIDQSSSSGELVTVLHSFGSLVLLLLWLLLDNLEHGGLHLFSLESKSVFIPDEIRGLGVEAMSLHAALEEPNDVRVIWVLGETETSAVVHEFSEFLWLVLAEFLDGHFLLLFLDVGVLLLLVSSWESLPWELTLQEVKEHMTNGFEVISSGLLVTNMGVDTGIPGSTCQVFTVSEWDVLTV